MDGPWEKYGASNSASESGPWEKYSTTPQEKNPLPGDSTVALQGQNYINLGLGALRGAANIGQNLMRPVDAAIDSMTGKTAPNLSSLVTGKTPQTSNEERRAKLEEFFQKFADTKSGAYKTGELGAEIAGTSGVGGALAKGVQFLGKTIPALAEYAPKLASALESGGMKIGGEPAATIGGKVANAATRVGAGATVGAASAGLVDSDNAGTGAAIGAALPAVAKIAGIAGKAISPKTASPEVQALYDRAKELGIDIPADRISNSRPLNALAASLNYVPLSGRAGTEETMLNQFNRALSRTFGQDSENVTGALKKANLELGTKFEQTLSNNGVKVDDMLVNEMGAHMQKALDELSEPEAKIIGKQIDNLLSKVSATGEVDGQAAYNIKKTLDRIGNRNSNEAYYARELKKSLMGALERSLGPEQASAFKQLRQQYGNMLDLEGVAQRGAEGGVSIGKLANMRDINNKDLSELADIAAQFLKTREAPHGAAQRVVLGTLGAGAAGATGTLPLLGVGIATGRVANTALNSNALKNAILGKGTQQNMLKFLSEHPEARAAAINALSNRANP